MKSENVWRYMLLGTGFSVLALLIIAQMVRIQLNPQYLADFQERAEFNSQHYDWVYPARGQIYDQWGHLLAGNTAVYEVGVHLSQVSNPHTIALAMNVVLGLDYATTKDLVSQPATPGMNYVNLDQYVSQAEIDRLEKYIQDIASTYGQSDSEIAPSLAGLDYQQRLTRSYPELDLAANILGFVGYKNDKDMSGLFGLEAHFNTLLAGLPLVVVIPNDPNRVADMPKIPEGASLILTIDREVQGSMEDLIDQAVDEYAAVSGTIVVLEPSTGEVLAMATTPRLDLNRYWEYTEFFNGEQPFNPAISRAYEPGSVYKVLTMAAAFDRKAVDEATEFVDTGMIEIGGLQIYNWNYGAWGPQTMQGCMQHSLNVCLAWVAKQTGARDFYNYMKAFGIGRLTGIDLAGEVAGRLKQPGDEDWFESELGTNAFGQGVSATPLQMAVAVSALANHGKMMTPHIVRSLVDDGTQFDTEPHLMGMPISPETAERMTEMLANSLEEEASNALVEGYRMAGKTGTAEIPTPYGYTSNETNASFVGWGPVDDPRFVVYVWLERPKVSIWGSEVAAPVFADAVERLVTLMRIPPDNVRHALAQR